MVNSVLLSAGLLTGGPVLVDIAVAVGVCVLLQTIFLPVIRLYRQSKFIDQHLGSDNGHWFYGHLFKYPQTENGFRKLYNDVTAKFPASFNYWIGPFFSLPTIYHPDTVAPILTANVPKSDFAFNFVRPWLGDGLILSKGEKWKRHRKMLTPAFHFNMLKKYTSTFNECSLVMLDKFAKLASQPIDVEKHVNLMTLDVILQCAMSTKTHCQLNRVEENSYLQAVHDISEIIPKRIENPLLQLNILFNFSSLGRRFYKALDITHSKTKAMIAERRSKKAHEVVNDEHEIEVHNKSLDFLDILLGTKDDGGIGLTDQEIREEMDTFMFAGHDTTSSAISFLLYNLASHQDIQNKCRDEVLRVMATDKDEVEWSDLSKFEYLTMVVKENLRLYNPVYIIGRGLDRATPLKSQHLPLSSVLLPKDLNILVNIGAQHRHKLIWDNPEEFNPERFTKEAISKRPSHAFIPFSAGPRNCIGQNFAMSEIKVTAVQVLRRFKLSIDENSPKMITSPKLVLRSTDGIFIKFTPL